MKLLILTQDYPTQSGHLAMMFVHTRSLYYKKYGTTVNVVSFSCSNAYCLDGINVYPPADLKKLLFQEYDAVISHAPNLRNHLRVIFANFNKWRKIFFIFHGHEVLMKSNYYPQESNPTRKFIGDTYDYFKCRLWHSLIKKYGGSKFHLIFVSKYLRDLSLLNLGLKKSEISNFSTVIHNPVSHEILKSTYKLKKKDCCDFITIRPLNQPVYALDLLIKIAASNPGYNFHIYGKGILPPHLKLPKNVSVFHKYFAHRELPALFDRYRAGMMLSRHDTQGVMACDMAAYGLPLIVSNIPACKEMFKGLPSVALVDNGNPKVDLTKILQKIKLPRTNPLKRTLHPDNTALKELEYIMQHRL